MQDAAPRCLARPPCHLPPPQAAPALALSPSPRHGAGTRLLAPSCCSQLLLQAERLNPIRTAAPRTRLTSQPGTVQTPSPHHECHPRQGHQPLVCSVRVALPSHHVSWLWHTEVPVVDVGVSGPEGTEWQPPRRDGANHSQDTPRLWHGAGHPRIAGRRRGEATARLDSPKPSWRRRGGVGGASLPLFLPPALGPPGQSGSNRRFLPRRKGCLARHKPPDKGASIAQTVPIWACPHPCPAFPPPAAGGDPGPAPPAAPGPVPAARRLPQLLLVSQLPAAAAATGLAGGLPGTPGERVLPSRWGAARARLGAGGTRTETGC